MADHSPATQAIWAKYNDVLEHIDVPEDLGKPLAAAFRELAARIKVADEIRLTTKINNAHLYESLLYVTGE